MANAKYRDLSPWLDEDDEDEKDSRIYSDDFSDRLSAVAEVEEPESWQQPEALSEDYGAGEFLTTAAKNLPYSLAERGRELDALIDDPGAAWTGVKRLASGGAALLGEMGRDPEEVRREREENLLPGQVDTTEEDKELARQVWEEVKSQTTDPRKIAQDPTAALANIASLIAPVVGGARMALAKGGGEGTRAASLLSKGGQVADIAADPILTPALKVGKKALGLAGQTKTGQKLKALPGKAQAAAGMIGAHALGEASGVKGEKTIAAYEAGKRGQRQTLEKAVERGRATDVSEPLLEKLRLEEESYVKEQLKGTAKDIPEKVYETPSGFGERYLKTPEGKATLSRETKRIKQEMIDKEKVNREIQDKIKWYGPNPQGDAKKQVAQLEKQFNDSFPKTPQQIDDIAREQAKLNLEGDPDYGKWRSEQKDITPESQKVRAKHVEKMRRIKEKAIEYFREQMSVFTDPETGPRSLRQLGQDLQGQVVPTGKKPWKRTPVEAEPTIESRTVSREGRDVEVDVEVAPGQMEASPNPKALGEKLINALAPGTKDAGDALKVFDKIWSELEIQSKATGAGMTGIAPTGMAGRMQAIGLFGGVGILAPAGAVAAGILAPATAVGAAILTVPVATLAFMPRIQAKRLAKYGEAKGKRVTFRKGEDSYRPGPGAAATLLGAEPGGLPVRSLQHLSRAVIEALKKSGQAVPRSMSLGTAIERLGAIDEMESPGVLKRKRSMLSGLGR